MPTLQEEVIWAWEVIVAVEATRATVVRAVGASGQESTATWESVMALVRDAEG
jgi:hypothetical protein